MPIPRFIFNFNQLLKRFVILTMMLFNLANLPYWLFLGMGLFCFGLMFLGGDTDNDGDLGDLSVEIELEAGEGEFGNLWSPLQILGGLGFGKVPLLLLLAINFSVWGILGWMLNVLLGLWLGHLPDRLWGWGGMVLAISLTLSLVVGRSLSQPIGKLFVSFGHDLSRERIIGCVGTVTSKALPYLVEGRIGQANVFDNQGNLLTISVCLPDWARVIPHHNQEILIIDQSPHAYLAIAKDSSDQDKWLNQASQDLTKDLSIHSTTNSITEEQP